MAERRTKLRPDQDLQCYFQQPSAVAALSNATATGFRVSGCWREPFDWAVVEWSRDNVFEHPELRNLPDGDLSGIRLSYEETRTNCMAMDSTVYDAVGWSCLRIWEESNGAERFHKVALRPHATPVAGASRPATAELELQGAPTAGDYVELAWLDQHANWLVTESDTLESIVAGLAGFLNAQPDMTAVADGSCLILTYAGASDANGNRVGIYGSTSGARTESWSPEWTLFSGGQSPQRWRVDLDFSNLTDTDGQAVSLTNVRRMRWTWAADLQFNDFKRSEFGVEIAQWSVSGANLEYLLAGPGSRRIEDDSREVSYTGNWLEERGNYSGGSIRRSQAPGAQARVTYAASATHGLYLGTRLTNAGGTIAIQVDGGAIQTIDSRRGLEDVLIRIPVGQFAGSSEHTVVVSHAGGTGEDIFFDFLEIAVPEFDLPEFDAIADTTLATDWDTDHSLAIAPERTAWLIRKLGFRGRANHYVGAMWFYEICNPAARCASVEIEFAGAPPFGATTAISIAGATMSHLNLITDTPETVAKCFELLITAGSSAVWARADGAKLRIAARVPGSAGNNLGLSVSTAGGFTASPTSATMTGGIDGEWLTDLDATPRLNRAARDWTRSYIAALQAHGIDAAVAFSMELRNGDDSLDAGIAQRYPDRACRLSTPAVQTNFGPESTAFWTQVYRDMADVMASAGATPYLQFGEVQWWYFTDGAGMPFYDAYTAATFQSTYGAAMQIISSEQADPGAFPRECEFLPKLIGDFTSAVIDSVRQEHPDCRFEVLYPPDTNDTPLCRKINYPAGVWTPATLACLKTENFTFTGNRNLDQVRRSIAVGAEYGFPPAQRSHLVGIGDPKTPWKKERELAIVSGVESVVLFALDQFCLIGYALPIEPPAARSAFMGSA